MVGFKNGQMRKNLTKKMVNQRDLAGNVEEEKKQRKKKKK